MPSDSSEDNRKNQPRVLPVEAKKTADETNSDSDDIWVHSAVEIRLIIEKKKQLTLNKGKLTMQQISY